MERADHAAFEDRPETFNCVGVDCADDVLAFRMIDDAVRIFFRKLLVSSPSVGCEQTDFARNNFIDESVRGFLCEVVEHARNHVALAANGADDGSLAASLSAN